MEKHRANDEQESPKCETKNGLIILRIDTHVIASANIAAPNAKSSVEVLRMASLAALQHWFARYSLCYMCFLGLWCFFSEVLLQVFSGAW